MKNFKPTFNLNTFLVILLIILSTLSNANNSKVPLQSEIHGLVTQVYSGYLLENVQIKATDGVNEFLTQTDAEGAYSMIVTPGVYDFTFKLAGYYSDTIFNVEISPDTQTELNDSLRRFPYPPTSVYAEVYNNGQDCVVSWSPTDGSYEIRYDNADAEDYSVWEALGGFYAVKFSPTNFPVTVTGGRLYVGDGSFPEGSNFLGTTVSIQLFDDDGINNLPGTMIDSIILTVDNYYWLKFDSVFNHVVEDGSFYLAMKQLNNLPNVAPIGIDNDNSIDFRSYVKEPDSTNWSISPYQDFMIRANVVGEIIENKSANQMSKDIIYHDVFRINGFDPNKGEGPEYGIFTMIGSTTGLGKNDSQFGVLPSGYYGYAVSKFYDESGNSQLAYSNILIKGMVNMVSVTAELCCDDNCDDIEINLIGYNYPYQSLSELTNTECNTVFEEVIYGYYDILFHKDGYQDIILDSVFIYSDTSFAVVLEEEISQPPATNLIVDSVTLQVVWSSPLLFPLVNEDFEDEVFPPSGWIATSTPPLDYVWSRSDGNDNIPPNDENGENSWFAAGFAEITFGETDTLISPKIDLSQGTHYVLEFQDYYDASLGGTVMLNFSSDNGESWHGIYQLFPSPMWQDYSLNISEVLIDAGLMDNLTSEMRFGFFKAKQATIGIDNFNIHNENTEVDEYLIYLDYEFIAELPSTISSYSLQNHNLVFGQEYTVLVRAKYGTTLSPAAKYIFTSGYLYPPNTLNSDYYYGTDSVPLLFNTPIFNDSFVPEGLVSFNIYRNKNLIANKEYSGESVTEILRFTDYDVEPGNYLYEIGAVYNLETYGFPGELGESGLISADSVKVEILGITDLVLNSSIRIFPNPTTNTVNISSENEITKIEIFNQMGQKVVMVENVNSSSYKLNISQLERGSYILNLKTDEMSVSRKLIIGTK